MDIKEVVSGLPNRMAKFYKHIYVVNKATDEFYEVHYEGSKTKVSVKKPFKEINSLLNDYEGYSIESILISEKRVYKSSKHGEDLIIVDSIGDYKVIYIINIEKPRELSSSKHKIIVADDSSVITNFLSKIFSNEYEVLIAHNGDETIKLIEDNNILEIYGCFIDLNMPVSSGYKVLDYFKENDLFKAVPVSVISGEDDVETVSKITIEYDIVDMLQKPFSKDAAQNILTKTINFNK